MSCQESEQGAGDDALTVAAFAQSVCDSETSSPSPDDDKVVFVEDIPLVDDGGLPGMGR